MEDRTLADRFVTYSDALVAVSFVGTSGLSLAVADPDVRCSMVGGLVGVSIGNAMFSGIVSVLLVALRRWELDLRQDDPQSEKANVYSRRVHIARFAVVWLSAVMAAVIVRFATADPSCNV